MSVSQTIQQAIDKLGDRFTFSQLLLAAWGIDRGVFGLPGWENTHPSDRKLAAALYGARGLIRRGVLRVGDGILREGKVRVKENENRPGASVFETNGKVHEPEPEEIEESLGDRIKVALQSEAFRLWHCGRKEEVEYPHALQFWGGTANYESVVKFAALLRDPSTPTLRVLANIHAALWEKYSKFLKRKEKVS